MIINKIIQRSLLGTASVLMVAGFSGCTGKSGQTGPDIKRPNVIYILADDLGYGDLGCYGQKEIETPNIDQLASDGIIFTDHHSGSPVCAPSRCVLLTGQHSGHAQIRSNDEMAERGDVWNYHIVLADSSMEGQRPIAASTYTVGRLMQSAGYKTAIVGKWGLGAPGTEGVPNKQGFDFFYGYNCQRQAHTYFPLHLWKNDKRVYLNNDTIAPHGWLPEDADPYDPASYAPYNLTDYSSELMFNEITRFVSENSGNPFFLYWADPIPHLPLQAPKRWVDYYVNKFGDEEPYVGTVGHGGYFPAHYPHATYAAQISYLDENVGKLVQHLKHLGIYENTLIIFTSDNGPIRRATARFDSSGPFNAEYVKGYVNEGGIRIPMIASWPAVIKSGTVSDHASAFYDFMPTLADIVDITLPVKTDGISYYPTLKGEQQEQHDFLYWEYVPSGGQMAVRIGNLKALRKNMSRGDLKWELYDLDKDPEELTDISAEYPDVISRVEEIVKKEHVTSPNRLFRFRALGE